MDQEVRNKFETRLEREQHEYMRLVREHIEDFVQLYVRRNQLQLNGREIDLQTLEEILKVVKMGFDDGKASKFPIFAEKLRPHLDAFLALKEEKSPKPILNP